MEQLIADVKTVSFGNKGNTAVQVRAVRIGGEYQRTAIKVVIKVDQELGFANEGGPLGQP